MSDSSSQIRRADSGVFGGFYLTAMGIVSALGWGADETLGNLMLGSQRHIVLRGDLSASDVHVAVVPGTLPATPSDMGAFRSRNNQLALAALQQITPQVEGLISRLGADRIAVVVGTSTSGISDGEQALAEKHRTGKYPENYHYSQQEMGSVSRFIASVLDLSNLALTVSTACSSSAKALSAARALMEAGVCDAAIVGGVDSLCQLTVDGFSALASVSASICNPFSRNRDGITIGEGAALFIIDRASSRVRLSGIGESSDAHHMSAPHPEGLGALTSMKNALIDAGLMAEEIAYINAHGTATQLNDEVEALTIHQLFGPQIACSSTKSLTGHTLGAAGAIEAALCWLTLHDESNRLPPHIYDGEYDESLAPLRLVELGDQHDAHDNLHLMSNSFAFGGSNASLILSRVDEGV